MTPEFSAELLAGAFQLTLTNGKIGQSDALQTSTELKQRNDMLVFTNTGPNQILDASSAPNARFYRVLPR